MKEVTHLRGHICSKPNCDLQMWGALTGIGSLAHRIIGPLQKRNRKSHYPCIHGYLRNAYVTKVTFTACTTGFKVAVVRQFWGRTAERSAPEPRGSGVFFCAE